MGKYQFIYIIILAIPVVLSCSQPKLLDMFTYELNGVAEDPTYGYTEINPIKVGDKGKDAEFNELKYINALRGPDGQILTFRELGGCCQGLTKRKKKEEGVLYIYEVSYDSLPKPITLFLDRYNYEPLYAPLGLSFEIAPQIYDFGDNEELLEESSAFFKKKEFKISGRILKDEADFLAKIEKSIDKDFKSVMEERDDTQNEVEKIDKQLARLERKLAKENAKILTRQSDEESFSPDSAANTSEQDRSAFIIE